MQILENAVKTRWNVLPEDQRQGIRSFLTNVIISVATSGEAKQRVYLQKLNLVLVQVHL
jgi:exportin-1